MGEESVSVDDLRQKLDHAILEKDRLGVGLTVAATIAEALRRLGRTTYVVGGFAVETYSGGAYTTSDIDFATGALPEEIRAVMSGLGFQQAVSGCWMRGDLHVVVDFPGKVETEEWDRIVRIRLGDLVAHVLSIEDIILDRIMAARFWEDETSAEWARRLMIAHYRQIAWDLLESKAAEEGCADLLAEVKRDAEESLRQLERGSPQPFPGEAGGRLP